MISRTTGWSVVLVLCFAGVGSAVQAAEPETLPAAGDTAVVPAPAETAPAETSVPDAQRIKELAAKFKVPEATVSDMRQTRKMGWGEINTAFSLAKAMVDKGMLETPAEGTTGEGKALTLETALAQLLALREAGAGWGKVAQQCGFKLGEIKRSDNAVKKDSTASAKTERVEKIDKVEKPEKPERAQKTERVDKPAKVEKPDKPAKPDKPDKPEKPDKPDKENKPDKPGK